MQNGKRTVFVFTNTNGVAFKGYDPVAYFKANKAVKGSSEMQVPYNGATPIILAH